MLMRFLLGVAPIVLVAAVLAAQAFAGAGDAGGGPAGSGAGTNPFTGDAEAIAEGKRLWRKTGCYSCHGSVAEGGVGPSLTDDDWVYKPTDETLFKAIANGRAGTNMVGWSKDLDEEQIWKLIAFIRSLYQGDPNKVIW